MNLYRAGMVSRKYVEETLGLDALNTTPRATSLDWLSGVWMVVFDRTVWVDSLYLDVINENIAGWQMKGRDGRSWQFADKDDALLFFIRFK